MNSVYLHPHEPNERINPYYALFHTALANHGFESVGRLWVNDGWVNSKPQPGDILLFHWCLELLWKGRGLRQHQQLHSLIGFWRFLRLARKRGVTVAWVVHDMYTLDWWNVFDRIGYGLLARFANFCVLHSDAALAEFTTRFPWATKKCVTFGIGNYDGFYPQPRSSEATRAALGLPKAGRLYWPAVW